MKANASKDVVEPRGWHSRGYLPPFDGGEIPQFITFRLGDSLPQAVLDRWREELQRETGFDIQAALRRRIEAYLDQGYGRCLFERRAGGDDGAKLTVVSRWRALQTVVVGGNAESSSFFGDALCGD